MPRDARRLALDLLTRVGEGQQTLDHVMAAAPHGALAKKDRALMNALVFGVLRWQSKLDWIIRHFSNKPLRKIDPQILIILRMAVFQMLHLDRVPASAAVNTAVALAKTGPMPWTAGFVNAILRAVSQHLSEVAWPDVQNDPATALAVHNAVPQWLVAKWLQQYGQDQTEALCEAINQIPPLTVRTNTLKTTRNALLRRLQTEAEQITPTQFAPDGISFYHPRKPIGEWGDFEAGGFQVQDEAAQLVSLLLDPRPGDAILDACAGLGGKTGHLAQLMQDQGRITAMDRSLSKLERLEAEMRRLGVTIVETRVHDLNQPLPSPLPKAFDGVLLDAPCSGLGVLRRNPDAKWVLSKKDLQYYNMRQIRFLEQLAVLVRPGGKMVYAVCSNEPEETEAVVVTFLRRHPEFECQPPDLTGIPEAQRLVSAEGFFQTYPHRHAMDGFFGACLTRRQPYQR